MTNEPTKNDTPENLPDKSEDTPQNTEQHGDDVAAQTPDSVETPSDQQADQAQPEGAAETDSAEAGSAEDQPKPAAESARDVEPAAPAESAEEAQPGTATPPESSEPTTAPEQPAEAEKPADTAQPSDADAAPQDQPEPEEQRPQAEATEAETVNAQAEAARAETASEQEISELAAKEQAPQESAPQVEQPADETLSPEETAATEAAAEAAAESPAAEGAAEGEEETKDDDSSADDGATATPKKKKLSDEEAQPIWEELKTAFDNNELLTFTLARSIPGGAIVNYKGLEGFVPRSQFLISGRADQSEIDSFVGQEINLIVIEMTDFSKRKFVCSRKRALKKQRMMELKKGSIVEGKVTSITSYGAFVDLGGVDGLIHISRLSKVRVNTPNEVVSLGENVKVRIVDINEKDERIALSMKEFTESPWTHAEDQFPVGTTVKGKIRNITDFGVYVQLEPGIVGMVHISDLSWTKRIQHPTEVVKIGEEIEVKVMDVRPKDKRIALSLKDTQPDPWPRLANIYPPNTEADGTIKQIMEAGAIVSLDFDMDCFVPRGKMGGRRRRGTPAPTYELGDKVRVRVVEMDVDKHSFIGSVVREDGGESDAPQGREQQDYRMPRQSASDGGFKLGDLESLQQLLHSTAEAEAAEEDAKIEEAPAREDVAPEEPTAEEPKAEEPKAEEPKAEEPKVEGPNAEDSKADTGETSASAATAEEAPAVEPASTDEPSEDEPAAQRPVGEATGDIASTDELKEAAEKTPAVDDTEKKDEAPDETTEASPESEEKPKDDDPPAAG